MKKGILALAVTAVLGLGLCYGGMPVAPSSFTGSRSVSAGTVTASGAWSTSGTNNGFEISWDINFDGVWYTYEYAISGENGTPLGRQLSHWILETSCGASLADFIGLEGQGGEEALCNRRQDGNPGMPYALHGVRIFQSGSVVTTSFATVREPVWGDFYASSTSGDAVSELAWNASYSMDPAPGETVFSGWIPSPNMSFFVTLEALSATNVVGESRTLVATVLDAAGIPHVGGQVLFLVISGPNSWTTGTCEGSPECLTDTDGRASFTYIGDGGAGTDTIRVCMQTDQTECEEPCGQTTDDVCSQSLEVEWVNRELAIELEPPHADHLLGGTHTVTATVTHQFGAPQAGLPVVFTVLSGPNAGSTGTCAVNTDCRTDQDGRVSFTYVGDGGVGTDYIQASIDDDAGEPVLSNIVTATWREEALGLRIDLVPRSAVNWLGEYHTVRATVTDERGRAQPGSEVVFIFLAGPNQGAAGICSANAECRTDENGQLSFTYAGLGGVGTDVIEAILLSGVREGIHSNRVFKEWRVMSVRGVPTLSLPRMLLLAALLLTSALVLIRARRQARGGAEIGA